MRFLPPPPLGGGSMHSVRSLPVLLRVVAAGGSRPPPCISSCLLRTRVVAVQPPPALRLSYGVYHAFFFTCSFPSAQPVRLLRRSPWQALPLRLRLAFLKTLNQR